MDNVKPLVSPPVGAPFRARTVLGTAYRKQVRALNGAPTEEGRRSNV